jgi:hypothetical protein
MLKPGGRFYLFDVVFPSDMTGYEARFDGWIQSMAEKVGTEFAAEAETHIRDEHSTFDWIMEGFLDRCERALNGAFWNSEIKQAISVRSSFPMFIF